jgi:hypothetical protein
MTSNENGGRPPSSGADSDRSDTVGNQAQNGPGSADAPANGASWYGPSGTGVPPIVAQSQPGQPPLGQPPLGQIPFGQPAPPAYGAYAQPPFGSPYPQWTPPPKPGLLPLRPLGFGQLLMAPFQVLRRNPRPTFGSALLVQFVVTVASTLLVGFATYFSLLRIDGADSQSSAEITAGSIGMIIVATIVTVAISGLASALLQGVFAVEVARATLGEKQTMRFLWRSAVKRLWPLLGWFGILLLVFVLVAAILVGAVILAAQFGAIAAGLTVLLVVVVCLGLAVLWAWVGTKLALVPVIIVLENQGIAGAARRSWRLTTGNFWRTFGVIYLIALIISIASQVVAAPISVLGSLAPVLFDPLGSDQTAGIAITIGVTILVLIVTLVIAAISAVIQSSAVAVVYVDLRMRREGLDLELIRYLEARDRGGADGWPDPFTVVPASAEQPGFQQQYPPPGFNQPGFPTPQFQQQPPPPPAYQPPHYRQEQQPPPPGQETGRSTEP